MKMTIQDTTSIINCIVAVIAIIITIGGLIQAKIYWDREHRPWLVLNVKKQDSGDYYLLNQVDKNTLEVKLTIFYKNVGKTPAKNLKQIEVSSSRDTTGTKTPIINLDIPGDLVLMPGESYGATFTLTMTGSEEVIASKIKDYSSRVDKGLFIIPVKIEYKHFYNNKNIYHVLSVFDVWKDKVVILDNSRIN